MGRPLNISDAVWPHAGNLMVSLPDRESLERFLESVFEFRVNAIAMAKGRVRDFTSRTIAPEIDSYGHHIHLDVIMAPGLSDEERAKMPDWTRFCSPLDRSATVEIVVFEDHEEVGRRKTSSYPKKVREFKGLPDEC